MVYFVLELPVHTLAAFDMLSSITLLVAFSRVLFNELVGALTSRRGEVHDPAESAKIFVVTANAPHC